MERDARAAQRRTGRWQPALRISRTARRRTPARDPESRPTAGRRLSRGGRNIYSSDMHKTETVDYALLIEGDRDLVLDDGVISWRPGDMVIQVGAYHQWTSPRGPATV